MDYFQIQSNCNLIDLLPCDKNTHPINIIKVSRIGPMPVSDEKNKFATNCPASQVGLLKNRRKKTTEKLESIRTTSHRNKSVIKEINFP
jgi:hypothetical protein